MTKTDFQEFDPLEFKSSKQSEAALGALKREIKNILSSYIGWYDPFCELVQNALDAVDLRMKEECEFGGPAPYQPKIVITIDIKDNKLTVTDNGVGLNKDQFQQFLAPNFSFKSTDARGHKGVGATYVAYGFNFLQVATKTSSFQAIGKLIGARRWLDDPSPSGNPKVTPDSEQAIDPNFVECDRGVSITVRFDESTHPKRLDWIQAKTAEAWFKILSIKTGLGAIIKNENIIIIVKVIDSKGQKTEFQKNEIGYYWIYQEFSKNGSFLEIKDIERKLFDSKGSNFRHPDKISNLDFIYGSWNSKELLILLQKNLDNEEKLIIEKHDPIVSFEFGYTAKLWQKFNENLGIRANHRVMNSGIQMAANNMPQGETIQVPLSRNRGRENQLHFLFHFQNYTPDLGRKGFHRELTDFAKEIARKITENHLSQVRSRLKANTGVAPDLLREKQVSDWKQEMLQHETTSPLVITNENFFLPTKSVSITSIPTREQDVIALFHQLVAGGVIRGIKIMSTNERLTYDSLYKIAFDLEVDKYVYHADRNPLGITMEVANQLHGMITDPRVLEFKFCLDGLVEDIESGDKNIKDIDLAVVWCTGKSYKERYGINSLLTSENLDQRQYHGLTHTLCDMESGHRLIDLIVLEEMIQYLTDINGCEKIQKEKYD
ncbi:hypothetical protein BN873_p20004 [Candidatus Competibacter denitrificans Run_A_D11]|uniref:Uncharacterized protein n=1 Tax=Candidatus Competibacter denitrificans Run_A_D11 TaxID=1400863 RepID=W6MC32_9GAMM|nr:ATP-binding protein [Candidatus Competibacter denitrificans]CDI04624.1 hypothetical protein BN873_p20004 [Candidatus Competibacter denitrificans Run_A_D11]